RSREKVPAHATGTVSTLEQVPLVVLAVGAAVLGALALPPLNGILTAAMGGHGEISVSELMISAGVAAVVVLLMRRLRAPEPRWALGWLGLEAAAHAVVVRPSLALAHALARFDDQVVDRSVNALAGAVPVFARGAARVDDDGI